MSVHNVTLTGGAGYLPMFYFQSPDSLVMQHITITNSNVQSLVLAERCADLNVNNITIDNNLVAQTTLGLITCSGFLSDVTVTNCIGSTSSNNVIANVASNVTFANLQCSHNSFISGGAVSCYGSSIAIYSSDIM